MIAEIDDSLFPIIILNMLPVEISDHGLEQYLLFQEKLLQETNQKLLLIYNNESARFLSGDQFVRISKWSKSKEALFKENTLSTCVVTSSILSNLVIKSLKILLKSTFKAKVFQNVDQAIYWSQEQLSQNTKTCLV